MIEFFQTFVRILFQILDILIFVRILLSWAPAQGMIKFRFFLRDVTEPVLAPFRRIIPPVGMIDISPFVALIALDLLKNILLNFLSVFL